MRPALRALACLALAACAPAANPPPAPAPVATAAARPADPFTDLLLTPDDCRTPPREVVSRADALADVDVVERVLRRSWAGFETAERAGAHFDARFAELRRKLAAAPDPIAVARLEDLLVDALRGAVDSHTAFVSFSATGSSGWRSPGPDERAYTADLVLRRSDRTVLAGHAPAGARLLDCEGASVDTLLRPTVTEDLAPALRPITIAAAPPPPLRCRFEGGGAVTTEVLPRRRLRLGARPPLDPAFTRSEGAIPVIGVRSLAWKRRALMEAFAASANGLRDAKAIVLDARGNGGGSKNFVIDWFANLTSGRLDYGEVETLDSEVTRQGEVNDRVCALAHGGADASAREGYEQGVAAARAALEEGRQRAGQPYRAFWTRHLHDDGRAPQPFRAPLVVVVDARCGSACEAFARYVHQLPGGLLVGENTKGLVATDMQLPFRLPRSGLGMNVGEKHLPSPDPAHPAVEGRGYLPDLWIDSDDPVALAERLAACLAKPGCPLAAGAAP